MSQFIVFGINGGKILPNLREAKAAAKEILREYQALKKAMEVIPIYRLGRCGDTEYMERVGGVGLRARR